MTGETARRLFDAQHAASRREPALNLALRLDRLDRLRALVIDHETAFAAAISADFGTRSPDETRLLEIVPMLNGLRHVRRKLPGWIKPERRPVDLAFQPARAWVRHEPLGVIGIISPWNYPLLLVLSPLVDALAAGNRAILKPSELTPRFADLLKDLVVARFDETEVAVVTGGIDEAEYFSRLPFDHLVFTGSTTVGRRVMQAAAGNLTPVTLELGGKSPAIICPDYALSACARSVAFGKFINAGQTCIATDYALVPAAKARAFGEAVIAAARASYPVITTNPDYSAIISERHHQRLRDAITEAEAGGATVLSHEDDGADASRKIGPTVVLDAPADCTLMTEEIFGPILPVVGYHTLDEAISFVAARERPLALYCFTRDREMRARVLNGAISGGVTLNGTLLHIAQDALPFGGIGPSGTGAYHGHAGFLRFSHARGVHQIGAVNAFERLGPPWGQLARTAAKVLSRR